MASRAGRVRELLESTLSAYALLVFGSGPWLGALLFAATLVHPAAGLAGAIAALGGTVTASALGYRADALRTGYYGFNAALVGLALASGRGLDLPLAALCLLGCAGAALLTAVLGDAFHRTALLPVLVLPFVTLTTGLIRAVPDTTPSALGANVSLLDLHLARVPAIETLLKSFGAIVYSPDAFTGALVLVAFVAASRIATLTALAGLGVANVVGRLLHASADGALHAAYNGALTCVAVGAYFFVPGPNSTLAAVVAAAVAAWLSLALGAILDQAHLPVLAWPFVIVSLVVIRALHLKAADRAPYPSPLPGLSPEANLEYATNLSRRFGLPGPPQFCLPFTGTWMVSQGAEGEHTHLGAYEGALDFEIVDDQNFPFRGEGLETSDYFSFGAPVLAPGTGTVVGAYDGAADGRPGDMDVERPWGNAVVIQHGPDLFSVVAHLKRGSITVRPGAFVVVGQVVGACGASGRSPRPHLHLQAQRSAELGAPAVPLRLLSFTAVSQTNAASVHFHAIGLPHEGDRVAPAEPHPIVQTWATLSPGTEARLDDEVTGQLMRLRSEITPLGDRFLRDEGTGDRLYFTTGAGGLAFTTYSGRPAGPLRALFLAMPRLPSVQAARVEFDDQPPISILVPSPVRWLVESLRLVADPLRTRAVISLTSTPDEVKVTTQAGAGLGEKFDLAFSGRVELDAAGLRFLEVTDLRRAARPLVRARRAA
jgi:urea transporter